MNISSKPAAIERHRASTPDPSRRIVEAVVDALDAVKAAAVAVIDVRGKTPLTDYLVIASGNSDRHLLTMKDAILKRADEMGIRPLGIEGERSTDWILIDLVDCVVHLMRPAARAFYDLERLWSVDGHEGSPELHH